MTVLRSQYGRSFPTFRAYFAAVRRCSLSLHSNGASTAHIHKVTAKGCAANTNLNAALVANTRRFLVDLLPLAPVGEMEGPLSVTVSGRPPQSGLDRRYLLAIGASS